MKLEKGENVWIKGHRCFRCNHEWRPRDMEGKPKNCSNKDCKSPYWNETCCKEKKQVKQ